MNKSDLSARYYTAEVAVWLMGAILLVSRFVGLAPSQSLPLLNVALEKPQDFLRVVAMLLVAATFYMTVEWKLSSKKARRSYSALTRSSLTTLFSGLSLWLSYALIFANTRFAGISPAWYLGFWSVGFLLAEFVSSLTLASLMIRTSTEAIAINLPRIPVATRAQYFALIPAVFIVLTTYYFLCYMAPDVIKDIVFFIVVMPFCFIAITDFISMHLRQDDEGNIVSYATRIASFKKAFDSHEYSYYLNEHGREVVEEHNIPTNASPQVIQNAMQEEFSVDSISGRTGFHARTLEEFKIEFYFKDGSPDNLSPENHGIRILKVEGKTDSIRVHVIPDGHEDQSREVEIPTALVAAHAEKYRLLHLVEFDEVFKYAINQALVETMSQKQTFTDHPLLSAAMAGQEGQVEVLLKQDIDVNEQTATGWTALLSAAAQGYPRIVESLLIAGANPDIGNLHGITPLLYGARYGNTEVCRLLLEHGANTDLQDKWGATALITATHLGFEDVARLLLKNGASINLKYQNGNTALDFAHKFKRGNIARMIRVAKKRTQREKLTGN